jgi:hypothetical protein
MGKLSKEAEEMQEKHLSKLLENEKRIVPV